MLVFMHACMHGSPQDLLLRLVERTELVVSSLFLSVSGCLCVCVGHQRSVATQLRVLLVPSKDVFCTLPCLVVVLNTRAAHSTLLLWLMLPRMSCGVAYQFGICCQPRKCLRVHTAREES
jgi:hypothetical protein